MSELMTANEVLVANDLTWQVEASPVYDNDGKQLLDYRAIRRDDTKHVFHIAKNTYEPIQLGETLNMLDDFVNSGMAKYSGASAYREGAVVIVRANVPMDYAVAGDEIKTYLYVVTSNDGSIAPTIFGHSQRMICQNLLQTVKGLRFKFKHTKNYKLKMDEGRQMFAEYRRIFERQKEAYTVMASKQMAGLEMDSFLNDLLGIDAEKARLGKISGRLRNQKDDLGRLFVDGIGNQSQGVAGTKWAMFNAVTQYVTHDRSTKGDPSNREFSAIFGSGQQMIDKSFALLTK